MWRGVFAKAEELLDMPLSDDGFGEARGDMIKSGAMVFGKNRKSDFASCLDLRESRYQRVLTTLSAPMIV